MYYNNNVISFTYFRSINNQVLIKKKKKRNQWSDIRFLIDDLSFDKQFSNSSSNIGKSDINLYDDI